MTPEQLETQLDELCRILDEALKEPANTKGDTHV